MKPWYPNKPSEQDIIRKVMREAFVRGANVKQLAGYFRVSLCSVYDKLNVKQLRKKINNS